MTDFFKGISPVKFEGPSSGNPLAYHHYNKDEIVLGKTMEEHIRPAVAYWHSFAWEGGDPFGGRTFDRPWYDKGLEGAKLKADVAFELFGLLDIPFFCFHDADVAPEGSTLAESNKNLRTITDIFAKKMQSQRTRLLWGTANLFSNRRYMSGAATNPDPEVFAYAAGQVREMLEITHELGGANYVLWGGREGYDTILNTNLSHELDQLGRFLSNVVEYKHKIGFDGTILIEPKPHEPAKHQYDRDVGTVYGFLQRYGLENEIKVNIEANHATLAGNSFEHEIATAVACGIFGSIDINRGDPQNGWDTDQFPNDVPGLTLALLYILEGGGMTNGGFNFDAKIRRQSVDPVDLFYGHVGGIDVLAKALLNAEAIIRDGTLQRFVDDRYSGWRTDFGQRALKALSLDELAEHALQQTSDIRPQSGRQEYLENLINRFAC